ncbi:MAG: DUF3854 domain-containing protein [Candidatus Methylomirabilales bacterium]
MILAPPEYSKDLQENFHHDHLHDLASSGLTEDTIRALGIYTVRPHDIPKLVGWDPPPEVTSALCFPYPGEGGFCRIKLFPGFLDRHGHRVKYLQRPRSGTRLYLPDPVRAVLRDPDIPLKFTEGEKKTLAMWQAGYQVAGLGGVWNWLEDGQPIIGLDLIAWINREIEIVFDSNIWYRPKLLQCTYAFMRECEERGAKPVLRRVPLVQDRDAGIDDYLVAHGREAYAALETIPPDHKALLHCKDWYKSWRTRKTSSLVVSLDPRGLLDELQERKVLRFAQDVVGDHLVYGIPIGESRLLLSSARHLVSAKDMGKDVTILDGGLAGTCFTKDAAKKFLDGHTEPTPALLGDLVKFLRRFLFLRPEGLYEVVASWILGTYTVQAFRVFPYLIATSPAKRCGKTRLLEILHLLAFNASPVETNPTEAVLLREPEVSGGAILLDEMERLAKTDSERYSLLLSILNVGFTKGATVPRMEMVPGQPPRLRYFGVYAPRAIATIARMAATLEDRSIILQIPRKRREEPLDRFSPRVLGGEAQELRNRAASWALSHASELISTYETTGTVGGFSDLDDRQQDLWEPLYAIAELAAGEGVSSYRDTIIAQAKALALGRQGRETEESVPQLVKALLALLRLGDDEVRPEPTDLLQHLQAELGQAAPQTFPEMADALQSLDIHKGHARGEDGKSHRAWILKRKHLEDLESRYCPPDPDANNSTSVEEPGEPELDFDGSGS